MDEWLHECHGCRKAQRWLLNTGKQLLCGRCFRARCGRSGWFSEWTAFLSEVWAAGRSKKVEKDKPAGNRAGARTKGGRAPQKTDPMLGTTE